MKRLLFLTWIVGLAMGGCGGNSAPTAVIHVVARNTAASMSDTNALALQEAILVSGPFMQHVSQKLALAKLWDASEDAAVSRLRNGITVRLGNEPSTFVVAVEGLERGLAVSAVNELCDHYVRQTLTNSSGTGLSRMQVTIKARAQ